MTLLLHGTNAELNGSPTWITAIAPTPDEITQLTAQHGFPGEVLGHALDPNERPRAKTLQHTTFVVLRAPWFQGAQADIPYETIALGMVLGPKCGLTICGRDCELVRRLAEDAAGEASRGVRHRMLLHALDLTASTYLTQIDEINRTVDQVEGRLQRSLENGEVLLLLRYQKSLVHFVAALDATRVMLERLQKMPAFQLEPQEAEWLDDIRVEFQQALETASISTNVLSELMDAFASIISNNLNVVMKFLAAVTVILTLPVTIATFYGMNVDLPGQRSPYAFGWTIATSLLVSVVVAVIFRRRRWV